MDGGLPRKDFDLPSKSPLYIVTSCQFPALHNNQLIGSWVPKGNQTFFSAIIGKSVDYVRRAYRSFTVESNENWTIVH